jgi:hypothetical protein
MDLTPATTSQEVLSEPLEETVSAYDRLKKRRKEIAEAKTKDLPIPGYAGELIARYKLLDWNTVSRISKRIREGQGPEDVKELYAMCDTLISACEGLYHQNGKGDPQPLDAENPIRFDLRLAQNMGYEAKTARESIIGLFGNAVALMAHHNDLMEWMQDTSPKADEEFLGES